jgi:hypothetical protein
MVVGKSPENCQEFLVVDVVFPFSIIESLRVESYSFVFPLIVFLGEDGSGGKMLMHCAMLA